MSNLTAKQKQQIFDTSNKIINDVKELASLIEKEITLDFAGLHLTEDELERIRELDEKLNSYRPLNVIVEAVRDPAIKPRGNDLISQLKFTIDIKDELTFLTTANEIGLIKEYNSLFHEGAKRPTGS
jgi:hypothetical protein